MEKLSFKEQVISFYNADIVISPHGTALINIMFSIPHSSLIELNPPYFFEMWYINTASLACVHYLSVSTYYPNNITKLWKRAEKAYSEGLFVEIHRHYTNVNINPPVANVIFAIQDALEYIKRWHGIFEVSDQWSPLFYSIICYIVAVHGYKHPKLVLSTIIKTNSNTE